MSELRKAGTGITGREVYTCMSDWLHGFTVAQDHVAKHGPISLMWNGIPTPVYAGPDGDGVVDRSRDASRCLPCSHVAEADRTVHAGG